MKPKQLPKHVLAVIQNHLDSSVRIFHFWERDDTYFIVACWEGDIYCLRVFEYGNRWDLSQDNRIFNIGDLVA